METKILNSCGHTVYKIGAIAQFKRFLVLCNENNTYYAKTESVVQDNIISLETLLTESPNIVLDLVLEYAEQGKCKKYEPLVYSLARCAAEFNQPEIRDRAYEILPKIATTPTHLFMFLRFYKHICKEKHNSTGFNKKHRLAIGKWYLSHDITTLAKLITKYQNREGYTHTDVLRLAHIIPPSDEYSNLFKYILTKDIPEDSEISDYLQAVKQLKTTTDVSEAVSLIQTHRLDREHVPSNLLSESDIWNALLLHMSSIALIRNLNKMTMVNVIPPLERIISAKVHPMQAYLALYTYEQGKGVKGALTWKPNTSVVDSLNTLVENSFKHVPSIDKKVCVALDVSGSMHDEQIPPSICSAVVMALQLVKACNATVVAFSKGITPIHLDLSVSITRNVDAVSGLSLIHI
jgi:60 kDa SS-A/Ro ribonucleoprotein